MVENTQNNENAEKAEATSTEGAPAEQTFAEKLTEKLAESEQKYKYLYAEFENFKKRAIKERLEAMKFGWENIASGLLEVLDNLDRALQHAKPDTDPGLISGLKMVAQQFKAALEKQGVAEIATVGQSFNPELHEAVGQIPSAEPAGTIVHEQQKGYTLHGRLLRASRVLLSNGTPPPAGN